MKAYKKNTVFIVIVCISSILLLASCCKNEEENKCKLKGEIISYDYTECLCCPGWVIKTGNDTIKAEILPDQELVWKEIEKNGFPVDIEFDYTDNVGICSLAYKKITCLNILN